MNKKFIVAGVIGAMLVGGIGMIHANSQALRDKVEFCEVIEPRVVIDEDNRDQGHIELSKNQIFEVNLDEVAGTGYVWEMEIDDADMFEVIEDEFIDQMPEEIKNDPNIAICGVGGKHRWAIKALKDGETKVRFKLARSWEDSIEETVEYTVRVGK